MIVGNDVSRWQGDINFDVYKNNSNFLIIKASEGTGFTDPKFTRNQLECRRVGLPLGYYHFARPDLNNLATAEADWFLKVCGAPVEGEIYVLDYEANWAGDVVGWCKTFLDRVQQIIGVKCLIYLNQSQVTSYNWQQVIDAGYGLWIAAYTGSPLKNDFKKGNWPAAAMQQWTNAQTVPGVVGNVDGDCFFGDATQFKKYGYQLPVVVPPPPPPVVPPSTLEQELLTCRATLAQRNELLNQIKTIVWDRWTWIGTRGWKARLASLKELLPF